MHTSSHTNENVSPDAISGKLLRVGGFPESLGWQSTGDEVTAEPSSMDLALSALNTHRRLVDAPSVKQTNLDRIQAAIREGYRVVVLKALHADTYLGEHREYYPHGIFVTKDSELHHGGEWYELEMATEMTPEGAEEYGNARLAGTVEN